MKILFSIVSLAIALNLGTHVTVECDSPKCAMTTTMSCSCHLEEQDSCCQKKPAQPRCGESRIDGDFSPVFTLRIFNAVSTAYTPISLPFAIAFGRKFTPQTEPNQHMKPDKILTLPLLI